MSRRTPGYPRRVPTTSDALVDLVRDGVLDAELAALCWLLVEGGVPFVVTGGDRGEARHRVAEALMAVPPPSAGRTFDADGAVPGLGVLAEHIRSGDRVCLLAPAPDLRGLMERLTAPPIGMPEDAVRRLGLVLVTGMVPSTTPGPVIDRPRVLAAHYLRPIERDGAGHVQRRPPAVLATWDPVSDTVDHFAWGVTGELADRVDRSQASFEDLQASRAAAIAALAEREPGAQDLASVLATEPPRVPAPPRPVAVPSALHSPLTDPHTH